MTSCATRSGRISNPATRAGKSIVSIAGFSLSIRAPLNVHQASTRGSIAVGFDGTNIPEDALLPDSYKDANGAIWTYVRESAVVWARMYGKTTAYRGAASPWMYGYPGDVTGKGAEEDVKKWIDDFVNIKKKLGESAFSSYSVHGGADELGEPPVPTNEPPAGKFPSESSSERPTPSAAGSYVTPLAIGLGLVVAVIAVVRFT